MNTPTPISLLTDTTTDADLDALATAGSLHAIGEPVGGGPLADEDALRSSMGDGAAGHSHVTPAPRRGQPDAQRP